MPAERCDDLPFPAPERIQRLRETLFATEDSVCFERARIVTESYRRTEGEPSPIRRAKALRAVFVEMPIFLREGELLVGQRSSRLGARSVYPEYSLSGATLEEAPPEVAEYWRGRTLGDQTHRAHPEQLRLAERESACGGVTGTGTGYGHLIVDYPLVLREGFDGIVGRAKALLAETPEGDRQGRAFLESVMIAGEGIVLWANRYADLAEATAAEEADPARAAELRQIAAVCRRVPAQPARNFHEALQSFWFAHLAIHIEQQGWSISAGRFDQYAYPFFRDDVEGGALSRGDAWELLLNLWVKFMENIGGGIRRTEFQNLTIGGADADGRDQSNELSHLCLDATVALRFNQPALTMRWHAGIDPDFWEHACRTISHGSGMPAIFNDEVVTRSLTTHGVAPEDAIGYAIVGCVEAAVPGQMQGATAGGHLNVSKALELALNDGRSMITGERLGPATGPAENFETFEDLWRAYVAQSEALAALNIQASVLAGEDQKRGGHCPLTSSLLADCLDRRRDLVDAGTRYNLAGVCIYGPTNVYDSLAAIDHYVFKTRQVTWPQLLDALRSDFDGHEDLRRMLAAAPQRFGNDQPEVDALANRVNAVHAEFCGRHVDARGGKFICGVWPVEGHLWAGHCTAATPDGRHKGAPLVDGVGACQGADRAGPTALLKSVARLDHAEHWAAGNTCNIKFSQAAIASDGGLRRMGALLTTFMRLGGQQLQVNVVDAATLRAAQAHPEDHADLLVRVAGFSAYFTQLARATQDEILSRTEHA